jgi:hypothetical protein
VTVLECSARVRSGSPVSALRRLAVLSSLARASHRPWGSKASETTAALWALRLRSGRPSGSVQVRRLPSAVPAARRRLFGSKARHLKPAGPVRVRTGRPDSASHSRTVLSSPAEAIQRPSELAASALTVSE